jgi:formate dehydrogenase alpha subunit
VTGLVATLGSGAMTNPAEDFEKAEAILVIGSDTTEQHPLIASEMLRAERNGARLIVADPRRIKLTRFAHLHLRHRVGTDVALINGLTNVILAEGLEDKEFVADRTEGIAGLRESVREYDPKRVSEITGVPAEDIRRAARIYAGASASMTAYAMGITQHVCGTDNVIALSNLALITGHLGRPGAGLCPLRGQNNVQGSCDMGALPDYYTGYQTASNDENRSLFGRAWGRELPGNPGLTATDMFHCALEGGIKALYIMGENPLLSEPDSGRVEEALGGLELLVVQDIFLTETARLAHALLPGCSFAEKDGTFTNTERRVQRVRKCLEPIGDSKPDWEIICALSERLGYPMTYGSPAEIMDEIASLTPSYGGISYDRLERVDGLQWPCPDRSHPGTPIMHGEGFPRGRGRLIPVHHMPPAESVSDEYPMTLTTGRNYYQYHTGPMSRRSPSLEREAPEPYVEVNPEDAGSAGLRSGERAGISSRRGSITLKVRVTADVPPGTIFIPFHYMEAAANQLTIDAVDPESGIPEYKSCAVKMEKAVEAAPKK